MSERYEDEDWTSAFRSNCELPGNNNIHDLPENDSVFWTETSGDRKLNFRLRPGDIGGCSSDNRSRHGAPFWERAELLGPKPLQDSKVHEISFQTTFLKGFIGNRESFFQIHGWTQECRSAPWLMMKFSWRTMDVQILSGAEDANHKTGTPRERGNLVSVLDAGPRIDDLKGTPQRFTIKLDRAGQTTQVEVEMNGETLVDSAVIDHLDCAVPRVKFGIYRPGEINPGTSHVVFDNLAIISKPADTGQNG